MTQVHITNKWSLEYHPFDNLVTATKIVLSVHAFETHEVRSAACVIMLVFTTKTL